MQNKSIFFIIIQVTIIMSNIKVSIIIPIFQVESYIERCLCSVISQTYNHSEIECILVDDCGKDRSVEIALDIIRSYSGNIQFKIIHNDKNSGSSVSRNNGLKNACGHFVFFLDSDDYLTPDCIEKLLLKSLLFPELEVIKGNHIDKRNNETISSDHVPTYVLNNSELMHLFFLTYIPCMVWNTLISRELIERCNLQFIPDIIYEDVLWSFMLFKEVNYFMFVPDVTLHYEVNPNSVMNSKQELDFRQIKSRLVILNILFKNIELKFYVEIMIYMTSMILQLLDIVNHNGGAKPFCLEIFTIRKKIFHRTCRDFRLILIIFELLMFPPLLYLYNIRSFRKNYHSLSHIVCLTAKMFSFLHIS